MQGPLKEDMHNYFEFFFIAIQRLLKDGRHGLLCVLPNEKNGLKETERRLFATGSTPVKFLSRMSHRDTLLTLPKFKISFNEEIMPILKEVRIYCDESVATFTLVNL